MNKNKLIFWIIWLIIIWLIILTFITLQNKWYLWKKSNASWVLKIWIIGDRTDSLKSVVDNFKKTYTSYEDQSVVIENFSNYNDYSIALTSAIIWDIAPDIFVLNNNEKKSIFSNQIVWIDSSYVKVNQFRKKYRWVFVDDLVKYTWKWADRKEFLTGLPLWYETLWVFFNRRYVKDSDLTSITSMNNLIADIKEKKPNIIPLWIWNWSTVLWVADIITQFFMYEANHILWLWNISWNEAKKTLLTYQLYWDNEWYNGLNSKFYDLIKVWSNSLDLFVKWEIFMVMWYPSLINELKKRSFSKNFLMAAPFPDKYSGKGNTLLNYNYLVINKKSDNLKLANKFLWFLSTEEMTSKYLDAYPYLFPAQFALETEKLENYIDKDYNIILNDFYKPEAKLISFDKWVKNLYDSSIVNILDDTVNYVPSFERFQRVVLCKALRIATLENLSTACE